MAVKFNQLFSTGEYRKHLIILTATQVLVVLLFILFTGLLIKKMSQCMDKQIYAVISRIIEVYPDALDNIVPIITQGAGSDDISKGMELLDSYGYNPLLETFENPIFKGIFFYILCGLILFTIVVFLLNFIIFNNSQISTFEKIDKLSDTIMDILNGKIHLYKTDHREGLWTHFIFRFNQMVNKLKDTSDQLEKDKVFLKNTIADISHQLKTPMSSLIMYNDIMVDNSSMEEAIRYDFLNICGKQLSKMDWLIKSLLKLARMEIGSITYKSDMLNINEVLREVCKDLQEMTQDRKIQFIDNCNSVFNINGDKDWLCEAFGNIVKNAIQHTDSGGAITITLSQTPLFQRISISDDGEGISHSDLPHIFERFFKGSSAVEMESVGIGLSLSKMIIEGQGGDIRALSGAIGSEFITTFPY